MHKLGVFLIAILSLILVGMWVWEDPSLLIYALVGFACGGMYSFLANRK